MDLVYDAVECWVQVYVVDLVSASVVYAYVHHVVYDHVDDCLVCDGDSDVEEVVEVLVDSIDHICNIPHPHILLHRVVQTGWNKNCTGCRLVLLV